MKKDTETKSENNTIITVNNLTKYFGDNIILDKISLELNEGHTTVVIGPSGCGKTVLIKHLICLLRPTSGEVYFKNERIDNMPDYKLNKIRTHFGFLFQGGALFDSLSVSENIIFPIKQNYKVSEDTGIDELVNLSGGQRKRVALARAIALNPDVILYDEPTTGLDPIRSDIINELILKLSRDLGHTSIVVTHDMTSAYKIADRIVMLHEGKIIADGDADYIRNHPHPKVQQFINGRVSDDDLAALRAGGTIFKTQYLPRDFEG